MSEKLKLLEVNPHTLKPLPNNSKIHPDNQLVVLERSFKYYGFIEPIIITSDDFIIAGHGRVLAAKRARLETVPAIKVDFNSRKALAYSMMSNRSAELGKQNKAQVRDNLMELDAGDMDIEVTGYDAEDLANMMLQYDGLLEHTTKELEDEPEEVASEPIDSPELKEQASSAVNKCPKCGHEW